MVLFAFFLVHLHVVLHILVLTSCHMVMLAFGVVRVLTSCHMVMLAFGVVRVL
eukprot:symbB.v1.2.012156.t1/scaffold832.1/size159137/1